MLSQMSEMFLAFLVSLLMLPNGYIHEVGPDDTDSDDDNYDDDNINYDSDEWDVIVYTYGGNVNRPRNRGTYAFSSDFLLPGTWEDAAEDLHVDFTSWYHLPSNLAIVENPRLCCSGYYARYFEYRDPRSDSDYGEPMQEFFPEHHEWVSVKYRLNRINLYRISSNGV